MNDLYKMIVYEETQFQLNENIITDYVNKLKSIKNMKTLEKSYKKYKKKFKTVVDTLSENIDESKYNSDNVKKTVKTVVLKNKSALEKAIKDQDMKRFAGILNSSAKETNTKLRGLFRIGFGTPKNIVISIILLTMLTFLHLVASITFTVITGNLMTGLMLSAIVSSPIIGELGKSVAIRSGYGSEFLALFNIGDFAAYLGTLVLMGANPMHALIFKLLSIVGHYTTAKIQKSYLEKGKGASGYGIAVVIQAIINSSMFLLVESPIKEYAKVGLAAAKTMASGS